MIRITTSSATPTSPVSTIIHKHDGNTSNNSNIKDSSIVQSSSSSNNSIMSSQVANSTKINNVDDKSSVDKLSWHQNSSLSLGAQKSGMSSYSNADGAGGINDGNDSSKTNYSAMTKKRKAMHQANTSNRNSADENVNK